MSLSVRLVLFVNPALIKVGICVHVRGINQPVLSRAGRVVQEEHMICIVVKLI